MTIGERARQEQLERAERDPRRQWGWGVSQMASPEVRRAWEALDTQEAIERGEATVADLPEQYGGRPQGTTRRAIRQQLAWDAQQAARLAEEQEIRAQAEFQRQQERVGRQEAREQYRYNKEVEADLAKSTKDSEIEKQGMAFVSGLRQLDPRSSDYFIERTKLYDENPLALTDPNIQKLTSEFDQINKIYQERDQKKAQEAEAAEGLKNQQLVQLTKLAKLTGRNLSDIVQSNPETGDLIVDPVALGEAEADLATKPAVDPNAPTYRRESAKLREQLRQLDSKIITNRLDSQKAKTDKARSEFEQNTAVLEAQRNMLYSEYVGVQELLNESVAAPTPASEDEEPAAPQPTEDQIAMARRAIAEQPENSTLHRLSKLWLEDNNIPFEPQPSSTPSPQKSTAEPSATTPTSSPVEPRPAPTPEEVAPEAMLRDITDEATLSEELDKLYKQGYKFSPDKTRRELYARVSQQLKETRKSKNKEKFQRTTEIRKRMNDIGPFNPDPKLRQEYSRLKQERDVLLGA
jgi:hypothetical protein